MAEHDIGITRRDVLIGGASGLMLAAANAGPALAQAATVTGIVFEDRDGSGVAGAANPGLAGALVSNGRDVAVTGADGRYTLPLPDEATIFVVKPAGFMPPLDPRPTCRASIATISRRARRPPSICTFEGIAPTGPLPASVDFPLHRQDEPKAFDVVLMTDPQPETEAEVDFIREDLIEALGGANAEVRPHRRRRHVRRIVALSAL